MFEGIFQKSDQDQRGHLHPVGGASDFKPDGYLAVEAQLLQADVVFHVLNLFAERYRGVVGVVDHIAHHLGQLGDDLGRVGRLGEGQVVEVIEGVEQKVGVDLCLEEAKLRAELFVFQLFAAGIELEPGLYKLEHGHK